MPQVTIVSVDIVGRTWDIIVDGTRINTLSDSYPKITITRDHDFVAYVRSDFFDRRDEYIVRSSSAPNTVYLKQGSSRGFHEVSEEKANRENSRGCLAWLGVKLIIIVGILLLIILGSVSMK